MAGPIIKSMNEFTPPAKMELVSFLQPFFGVKKAPGPGAGAPTTTTRVLLACFDGGGSALTTGVKGDLTIPFPATITSWVLLADQSGSLVIDVWKDAYANYPPVVGDSIAAAAKPTLSSGDHAEDMTLTGWTKNLLSGDTLRFNIDSATTVTRATLALTLRTPL